MQMVNYSGMTRCPNCGSYDVSCSKRGYSWTYGCLGCLIFSIFGLLLGYIGQDKLKFKCNQCGFDWSY